MVIDGGFDGQTIRLEGNSGSRTVLGGGIIVSYAEPDGIGVCIEQYLAGRFASIRACSPRRGVAVLACELAGRPWPAIDLSRLKLNATGRMPRGLQRTRWMADSLGKGSVRQPVKTSRSMRSARGNQMFDRLLILRLELLFYATGSSVLQLFGWKDPSEIAA